MRTDMDEMWGALGLGPGSCVAFIGGGGKTTSILALTGEATSRGLRVVVTTTTRMWPPRGMPLVLATPGRDFADLVRGQLRTCPRVAVGSSLAESGKLLGLDPQRVCTLVESRVADVVLCEADGSVGRSLKVHGTDEPVVPACATSVGVVAGLDAIGQEPDPELIHRFEHFLAIPGVDAVQRISARTYARVLARAATRLDPGIRRAFILTKADDPNARRHADLVTQSLAATIPHPTVVIVSHRSYIDRQSEPLRGTRNERDEHASA